MVATMPQLNIVASLQHHHLLASNLWLKILTLWFMLLLPKLGPIWKGHLIISRIICFLRGMGNE
jgi:hypothetical protein